MKKLVSAFIISILLINSLYIAQCMGDETLDWRNWTVEQQDKEIKRMIDFQEAVNRNHGGRYSKGSCYQVAWRQMKLWGRGGYRDKLCKMLYPRGHKYYRSGRGHAWCEYFKNDEWLIYDEIRGVDERKSTSDSYYREGVINYTEVLF